MGRRSSGPSSSIWATPKEARLRLNFDGSCAPVSGWASIGGVFRNHEGGFVLGYAARIGKATCSLAELVALKRGLELALENGWRDISIEGDCSMVVNVVKSHRIFQSEENARQVEEIRALLLRLGEVAVSQVPRKRNKVADGFAKLGRKAHQERVWRDVPPDEVLVYIRKEAELLGKRIDHRCLLCPHLPVALQLPHLNLSLAQQLPHLHLPLAQHPPLLRLPLSQDPPLLPLPLAQHPPLLRLPLSQHPPLLPLPLAQHHPLLRLPLSQHPPLLPLPLSQHPPLLPLPLPQHLPLLPLPLAQHRQAP